MLSHLCSRNRDRQRHGTDMKPLDNINTHWRATRKGQATDCLPKSCVRVQPVSVDYSIRGTSELFAMPTDVAGRPGSSG